MKFLLFLPLLSSAFFKFYDNFNYNFKKSPLFSIPIREPDLFRKYPLSRKYYEEYLKRLNSRNITTHFNEVLNNDDNKYKNNLSEITKEMIEEKKEEMIEVLYCNTYGGWSLSEKARKMYGERKGKIKREINRENTGDTIYFRGFEKRHDPILLEIYKELGTEFDGKYSYSEIEEIPKKYENYYTITEYDGLETVVIDYHKYDKDMYKMSIEIILKSEMNNDDKIKELEKFVFKHE